MAACYHDSKNELKHTYECIGFKKKRKINQAEKVGHGHFMKV